jgi:hypothetical protein
MQDDMNPDDMAPDELNDVELLLYRQLLRVQIVNDPANVSPELSSRYRAFNEEVDRRRRGEWS